MRCTLTLKDVQHILDLRLNLISMHMLDKDGYNHFINSGNWKLTKGSLVVARGQLCCLLYKTQVKMCGGKLNVVDDGTSPDLWHKRLAHMSKLDGVATFGQEVPHSYGKRKIIKPLCLMLSWKVTQSIIQK